MKKITKELVKQVFLTYFSLALFITVVHVTIQYYDEHHRVKVSLEAYKDIIWASVGRGLWQVDNNQVKSSLNGVTDALLVYKASAFLN